MHNLAHHSLEHIFSSISLPVLTVLVLLASLIIVFTQLGSQK